MWISEVETRKIGLPREMGRGIGKRREGGGNMCAEMCAEVCEKVCERYVRR
jgi:hypothetical protein